MKIFISYAHANKEIVKHLVVDNLASSEHDVWFDERLKGGEDWKVQLRDEIKGCETLIYCMTSQSIASEMCQWEIEQALTFNKKIIPVLLQKNTKIPDNIASLQKIQKLHYIDFTQDNTANAVAKLLGSLSMQNKIIEKITKNPVILSGVFTILATIIAGIFGLWQGFFVSNTPIESPTLPIIVTETEVYANLILYRSEEALTLYIPEGLNIELHDIAWGIGEEEITLSSYNQFGNRLITERTCIRLEYRNTQIHAQCSELADENYLIQSIGLSDVFWYDDTLARHHPVNIQYQGYTIATCPANSVTCEIAFEN